MLSLHSISTQAVLDIKLTITTFCEMGPVEVFLQATTLTKEYAETQCSPIKKKIVSLSFSDYSHRCVIWRKAGSTGV